MKFLTSGMADLKLRVLERVAHSANHTQAPHHLSSEAVASNKAMICQAVEDRICKRIDLAKRADLTDGQAIDALRLLIRIVRTNGLSMVFSAQEIALLARGIPLGTRTEHFHMASSRLSPF